MYTTNQIHRRIRSYLRSAILSKRLSEIKSAPKQAKSLGNPKEDVVSQEKPSKDSE